MARKTSGLFGVGYEGKTVATLVDQLVAEGCTTLVDVRLNPVSRKPGFSKRRLGEALAAAGIEYQHRPELGNPKENRAGFGATGPAFDVAVRTYATRIAADERARSAIEELARAGSRQRVAVLCYESDDARCHRQVILSAVCDRHTSGKGSTRQGR
jgi:uncharacterized protein (DUF488 family)